MQSIMDYEYDEVIMDNVFYQTLIENYRDLFLKCVTEGCILCVPRSGSVSKLALTFEDFCAHILVPNYDLPQTHFSNINCEEVRLCNGIISVEHEIGHQSTIHVLFEETFYTEDDLKYKVLCLEKPIETKKNVPIDSTRIVILKTLKECLDFLWLEKGSSDLIEKINQWSSEFLKANHDFDNCNLQTVIELTNSLYVKCVQSALKCPNIQKRIESDKTLLTNIKIAVETCMQHNIYNKVMKGISTCVASEDANLNKIIRNLSNLQIQDFGVSSEFYDVVPIAKFELSKIDCYSTVLGKSRCLKKMFMALTNYSNSERVVSADDMLEIFIFLIIKIGLSNWNAQLKYLKYFRFSALPQTQDKVCFLISSFEAALEHIQSEVIIDGSSFELKSPDINRKTVKLFQATMNSYRDDELSSLHNFFKIISTGNIEEVKLFINRDINKGNDSYMQLCHPLCPCSMCNLLTSQDNFLTVNSCDSQGLTPLHIASMYHKPMIVEFLLTKGADPNKCDFNGLSPIHYAAMKGHQNGLLLIAHGGGDVNLADFSLNTPLHYCADNGHENCVKALIYFCENSGLTLNINAQNSSGDSPLHKASRWGYLSIVDILLEHGADPTLRNKRKFSPIDLAHNSKILELLTRPCGKMQNYVRIVPFRPMLDHQEETESLSKQTIKGFAPNTMDQVKKLDKIFNAIADGDCHLTCYYLGIDGPELKKDQTEMNCESDKKEKCHPLCRCSSCETSDDGQDEVETKNNKNIEGMNVNTCNPDGFTPLHVAAEHGRAELSKILIQNGAFLNAQTRTQLLTPLMLACQYRRCKIVKILLKADCNIDMQDQDGNTALHHACSTRDIEIVRALIECDPDINIRNHKNKTALQEAKENMFIGVLKAIKGRNFFSGKLPNHF